jgi:hypothetical protein
MRLQEVTMTSPYGGIITDLLDICLGILKWAFRRTIPLKCSLRDNHSHAQCECSPQNENFGGIVLRNAHLMMPKQMYTKSVMTPPYGDVTVTSCSTLTVLGQDQSHTVDVFPMLHPNTGKLTGSEHLGNRNDKTRSGQFDGKIVVRVNLKTFHPYKPYA